MTGPASSAIQIDSAIAVKAASPATAAAGRCVGQRNALLRCTLAALLTGSCAPRQERLRQQLESSDPAERIRAVIGVVEDRDADFVPALVKRLDDDDPAVRMCAILALEQLTGTRLEFDYAAPRQERRAAIQNWRGYLRNRASDGSAKVAADDPAADSRGDAW